MSTLSATFLAVLSFAVGVCPHGAHAQDLSASDILKRVAQTYRQVSSFTVVAEKKVDFDTERRVDGPDGAQLVGTEMSYDIQVTLMASGSSKAKLLLQEGKKEIVVVWDGKAVWTLIPAQHTYTKVTTAGSANIQTPTDVLRIGSNDISGVDLLRQYETLVAGRFQSISSFESWTKLERSETLKVDKDKKECYVLTIQEPGRSRKQKLWVGKKEFIVWKSVETTLAARDYLAPTFETTITVTTERMALNPTLDESNFVFTASDQAKNVDSLILSGDNHF
jgi:outer membrane lipoprotein-sorting protein